MPPASLLHQSAFFLSNGDGPLWLSIDSFRLWYQRRLQPYLHTSWQLPCRLPCYNDRGPHPKLTLSADFFSFSFSFFFFFFFAAADSPSSPSFSSTSAGPASVPSAFEGPASSATGAGPALAAGSSFFGASSSARSASMSSSSFSSLPLFPFFFFLPPAPSSCRGDHRAWHKLHPLALEAHKRLHHFSCPFSATWYLLQGTSIIKR